VGTLGKKLHDVSLDSNSCLYRKETSESPIFLVIYVDDGMIMGNHSDELKDELKELQKEFKLSIQPLDRFLGIEIKRLREGIFIHQEKYIKDMLQRFGMSECKTADTPM
jgi:hypothetical protein